MVTIYHTNKNKKISLLLCLVLIYSKHSKHTDPEFQAIVQGLEVSSPSFRAIFGVLFVIMMYRRG